MKSVTSSSMRSITNGPGKQTGLSLIELMIASVIGLVLLSGVVTIFSSNSASSKMSTGMTRVQDSGRVALDLLSYSVRMAGYEGCRDETKEQIQVIAKNPPTVNFPDNAIWGSEVDASDDWNPARHADFPTIYPKPNTDVLYVQYGSGRSVNLQSDMASNAANVVLPRNPDTLDAGDLVIISDCHTANIFRASKVSVDATGNTTIEHSADTNDQSNLTKAFSGTGTMNSVAVRVMKFESQAYYVGYSGRNTPGGSPIWSLFELDTSSTETPMRPTELIEGVEDFQVLYGVQADENTPSDIRYVTANNVANTGEIVSVQLGLLISTAEYASSSNDAETYNIAGWTVGPPENTTTNANHAGDRRIRASFNTTIQLRNRL